MTNKQKQYALALGLVALTLSGCATEDYVNQHIAAVNGRIDQTDAQVQAQGGRITALETKVTEYDSRIAAAEKGKFNFQKVGEQTVLFDTGSYKLKADESAKLDTMLAGLKSADRSAYLEIEGFADPRGKEKSNRELGLRRAREVYNYFRDQGVALNRMMLFSHGEEHQIDTGHADNRRVVVTVVQ
jgi:peptidoglycan-associated lipoprotein